MADDVNVFRIGGTKAFGGDAVDLWSRFAMRALSSPECDQGCADQIMESCCGETMDEERIEIGYATSIRSA